VPFFAHDDTTIYFEERGAGFPLLLLAPGGMRSAIEHWAAAAVNPWESYRDDFRLVAMDQRNAGRSRGPLEAGDPWGAYASDQLGLLDHLEIDQFAVMGCCIGGSFILKLIEEAPDRLVAAVLEQPIAVDDSNAPLFEQMQRSWGEELIGSRSELDGRTVDEFLAAMWHDDFVVSVSKDAVANGPVPLLVLPGIDEYHPTAAGREIAALAPDAELLEPWKDSSEQVAHATEAVRRFLLSHVDRGRRPADA
jgi:pimeloyl-ACP methyl ester carboxylesterase